MTVPTNFVAHSRGPWEFITIANDYGKVVCHEEGIHDTVCTLDYDNAASNGRLIAAAPDLLAALMYCEQALEQVRRYGVDADGGGQWIAPGLDKARAAIAKVQP